MGKQCKVYKGGLNGLLAGLSWLAGVLAGLGLLADWADWEAGQSNELDMVFIYTMQHSSKK